MYLDRTTEAMFRRMLCIPLPLQEIRDTQNRPLEEPMMTNPKPEEPACRPPTEANEDWAIRIERAKAAREQGQKAREGKPPLNPIPRMPLSLNHD